MRLTRDERGLWSGRTGALHLRWAGIPDDVTVEVDRHGAARMDLEIPDGGHVDLVLEISSNRPDDPLPDADRLWHLTEEAWASAVPSGRDSLAPRDVAHSWAVLRGLTSASGAMVAAATTSLPERADQGRDYDYRYAWIRDQCFTGQAVAAAGGGDLLDSAVGFVRDRLLQDGHRLAPAYTCDGEPVPGQRTLDLAGLSRSSGRASRQPRPRPVPARRLR